MQRIKARNVNPYVMLFIITLFQLICFLSLVTSVDEQYKSGILMTFGGYLLVEYAYFIGARMILKRRGFEVELIAFLLTSIGLSITASVYPDGIVKQFIAVLIGIGGFVLLQWFMRDLKLCIGVRVPVAIIAFGLLAATLVLAKVTFAKPILFSLSLTGTATCFKCIPIKVEPMSIPASALINSTATGLSKFL